MTRDDTPHTGDYFQEVSKALQEFHEWNARPQQKPLYMLIKVEVDRDIVHNQDKAEAYAENHCNSMEYELVDWFYPNDMHEPCYPFIKL